MVINLGMYLGGQMKKLFLIGLLLSVMLTVAIFAGEDGWIKNPSNNHYYRLTEPLNWVEAEAQAIEWGGHLVILNSREEELWIKEVFGEYEYFWIGFNDREKEGKWEWSRGGPVTYTNWAPGAPDDLLGEDAAVMNWGWSGYGNYWNDVPENYERYRGVVEKIAMTEGEEFQVNTYTPGTQWEPAIAMDKNGNFVITWRSDGQDGSSYGIFAQRFNSQGQAVGKEFQVNTYTINDQSFSDIAMDEKGNFVITWESNGQDGSSLGIFAQRFNNKGKPVGKEFQVNTYTNLWQKWSAVAMDKKGNFVITWQSHGQDGSSYGIFAQRYNNKGKRIGKEFQVNTYTTSLQQYPDVAMDIRGNFVITWTSDGQDGDSFGIFARRYNKKGKPVGKEFQVNTHTVYTQVYPAIAMDKKGNFVIAWQSHGPDGSGFGIFARRFTKKGKALGDEFQVNTYTNNYQYIVDIAMDKKGNFIITWESQEQDGSKEGIFAQRFNNKGQPIGVEFQVNTYTQDEQWHPAVDMDEKGKFVITWSCKGQDDIYWGVFAKMFWQ